MTILSDLLDAHSHSLTTSQAAAVSEFIRRRHAQIRLAYPEALDILSAQSGYVLFERQFCDRPVKLFGQDTPSIAHTRLRIFRARPDTETGALAPDEEILGARISEKSLTETMFSSNRGHNGPPVTLTRLGDYDVPAHQPGPTRADRGRTARKAELDAQISRAIDEARSHLATGPARPAQGLRDAVSTLHYRARDLREVAFQLGRHLEAMSETRNEVITEAAHAALHAGKVAQALSGVKPAIAAPAEPHYASDSSTHPMLDFLLDEIPDALRAGIQVLVTEEITQMSQAYPALAEWIQEDDAGIRMVAFPERRGHILGAGPEDDRKVARERIEAMQDLWNHCFNPSIDRKRNVKNPSQGSLAVSQRHGSTEHIHSSFPPSDTSYFSLRVSAAHYQTSLGATEIWSDGTPLIEIEITAEDLMTALRGHPDGLPIPCSIRSICGVWERPEPRPQHPLSEDIATFAADIADLPEVRSLVQALDDLSGLVNSKRSGKAWRAEVDAKIDEVAAAFAQADPRIAAETDRARDTIDAHVSNNAREMLESISRSLPQDLVEILRISGK